MSISGVFDYFSGRPRHPIGADGRMALSDHLRELRARLLKSVLVLVLLFIVALFFYDQPDEGLLGLVLGPYNDAREMLGESVQTEAYVAGATGPLMLQLKLCGIAAIVRLQPVLALPDLGVHRARPARQREDVVADLRGHRRPALPDRRRDRLLRAPDAASRS